MCDNLYAQYFPEKNTKHSVYALLYPLLQLGTIESYGSEGFKISPSLILKKENKNIGVNLPNSVKKILSEKVDILDDQFGVTFFVSSNFVELDSPIEVKKFDINKILFSIPNLTEIVSSNQLFKLMDFPDSNKLKFFKHYSEWTKPDESMKAGIYREGDDVYHNKFLFDGNSNWYRIPSLNDNIDGLNLSVCFSRIQNNEGFPFSSNHLLDHYDISDIYFPLLLKRVLLINNVFVAREKISLLSLDNVLIPKSTYKYLAKIFVNKIRKK